MRKNIDTHELCKEIHDQMEMHTLFLSMRLQLHKGVNSKLIS